MTTAVNGPRVARSTVQEEISRLRTYVGRMEHRYEMRSENLEPALDEGQMRETAEICRWLQAWESLRDLETLGDTTGSRTTNTR